MQIRRISIPPGFTLVELLVVMVVLAVSAALVALSITSGDGHVLEAKAAQLAMQLETARWQAISTGRRAAWEAPPGADGNATDGSAPAAWWYDQTGSGGWQRRLPDSDDLPQAGMSMRIVRPLPGEGAPARLVLGPEPVGAPACVLLMLQSATVAVASDGVAPFAVRRDARC